MKTSQIKLKTSLKPYPEYKDSGIDWIGEIPKDWDLLPWRSGLIERKEKNKKLVTDNILSVTKDRGVIRYADKGDIGNKSSDRPENYKIVYPNDIVINSMNLVIGSVGIARELGVTSSVYLIYRANKERIYIDYIHYLIRTVAFQKYIAKFGKGIMELRESIKADDLKKQLIAIPSIEEQKKIAKYLDEKTELIDQIVKKKKKLIELLKEKRTAIINQAVTKGLDPNTELVDSGIDWIGKIPKDYDVITLNKVLDYEQPGPYITGSISKLKEEGMVQVLTAGKGLIIGYTDDKNGVFLKQLPVIIFDDFTTSKQFISEPFKVRSSAMKILKPRNFQKENLKYFYYCMKVLGFQPLEHNRHWISMYRHECIPHPSYSNQEKIVRYLDEKTVLIDQSVKFAEISIEKLKEFKSALISNVVTGKVKV